MNDDIDRTQVQDALKRVRARKSAVRHETQLFMMFLFGVFFGVLSSLMASIVDNLARGIDDYPSWYVLTILTGFMLVLLLLSGLFVYLRRERRDVAIMEHHLDMMLAERK